MKMQGLVTFTYTTRETGKKKSDFTCQDVANRHFDSAMKCTACTFLAKYLRKVSMQISSMNFILPNNTSERVYSGNPDG